jgi:hypothetical protein
VVHAGADACLDVGIYLIVRQKGVIIGKVGWEILRMESEGWVVADGVGLLTVRGWPPHEVEG